MEKESYGLAILHCLISMTPGVFLVFLKQKFNLFFLNKIMHFFPTSLNFHTQQYNKPTQTH